MGRSLGSDAEGPYGAGQGSSTTASEETED